MLDRLCILIVLGLLLCTGTYGQAQSPNQTAAISCPSPLVSIPEAYTPSRLSSCHPSIKCCLRCPATDHLYPPGTAKSILPISVLRLISTICALLVFISYIILPGKREHPRVFVLYISGALVLAQILTPSWFFGDEGRNVFCAADGVTNAQFDTNAACAVQGIGILWAWLAMMSWCVVLIVNMHMQIVWANSVLSRYHWALHGLCWSIPSGFTVYAIAKKAIQYSSGGICFITNEHANNAFFRPMLFGCIIIALAHFGTTLWLFQHALGADRLRRWLGKKVDTEQGWNGGEGYVDIDRTMLGGGPRRPSASSAFTYPPASVRSVTNRSKREVTGIRTVQIRLTLLGGVLFAIGLAYGKFYKQDLSRVNVALTPSPLSPFENNLSSVQTSPLEDFLSCFYNSLIAQPTVPAYVHHDTCMNQLSASGRILLPERARRLFIEVMVSLAGILLFMALGFRLRRDWVDWWAARRGKDKSGRGRSGSGSGSGSTSTGIGLHRIYHSRQHSTATISTTASSKDLLPSFSYKTGTLSSALSTSASTTGSSSHIAMPAAARTTPSPSPVPSTTPSPHGRYSRGIQGTSMNDADGFLASLPGPPTLFARNTTLAEKEAFGPNFAPW